MERKNKTKAIILGGTSVAILPVGIRETIKGFEEASGTVTLYHGTSTKAAKGIMKDGKLKPSGTKSFWDSFQQVDKNAVYVSRDKSSTKAYANLAAKRRGGSILGEHGTVLKYKIPTKDFIKDFKVDPENIRLFKKTSSIKKAVSPNIFERYLKHGTISNKYLSQNFTKADRIQNFKNTPNSMRAQGLKRGTIGLALLTGGVLAGIAAYKYFNKTGKGKWITVKGRRFLMKDK